MDDGSEWVYPSERFKGVGSVNERPVRCLSPEVQVWFRRWSTRVMN